MHATSTAFSQDIGGCLSSAIGDAGLSEGACAAVLRDTGPALQRLRDRHADGSLPLLRLPAARDDLAALAPVAERFRAQFSDVVVLGTGGSSLGGRTLCALADRGFGPRAGAPRLHFMDNVDPDTFAALLAALDPSRTGVLAVSKSGSTAETLTQLAVLVDALRAAGGDAAVGRQVVAVTEPTDNPLAALARRFGMETLDHDPLIGGRFSVLSVVGLLPAMIAGLDAGAVRAGAAEVLDPVLAGADAADCTPALGAAVSVGLAREAGCRASVLMPYADRLADFGLWYCQLWAESLGKDGQGTTPIRAVGTVDQHSQLQLYLGGPADKMYTVLLTGCAGAGDVLAGDLLTDDRLSYLRGRTMGDLFDAEGRATAETLIRNRRPTRIFRLDAVDERALGALLMHFMLETIIAADLLGVDAFDQPAVEEGKVLTREYLSAGDRR